ncbi:MAG: type II toxin-antitoxin system VapB family antitoxin, partial [Chloroflexota bacterium]
TMSLNIKNAETYRLVKELAEATGETMTGAVTEAVRERLDRIRDQNDQPESSDARVARLLAMAKEIGDRMPEPYRSMDHGDLLYDDMGLPK